MAEAGCLRTEHCGRCYKCARRELPIVYSSVILASLPRHSGMNRSLLRASEDIRSPGPVHDYSFW